MKQLKVTVRICRIKRCQNISDSHNGGSRKLCNKHYHRYQRYGNPLIRKHTGKPYISNGYKFILIKGFRIREHRFVMEKHIGRPLKSKELVHHKDGNTLNNRISNLEIFSRGNHCKFHNPVLSRYRKPVI